MKQIDLLFVLRILLAIYVDRRRGLSVSNGTAAAYVNSGHRLELISLLLKEGFQRSGDSSASTFLHKLLDTCLFTFFIFGRSYAANLNDKWLEMFQHDGVVSCAFLLHPANKQLSAGVKLCWSKDDFPIRYPTKSLCKMCLIKFAHFALLYGTLFVPYASHHMVKEQSPPVGVCEWAMAAAYLDVFRIILQCSIRSLRERYISTVNFLCRSTARMNILWLFDANKAYILLRYKKRNRPR